MSRKQVIAAREFANVITGIIPLLSIRPEWEIRFRMDINSALQLKFIRVYHGWAFTVEHRISQRRHFEDAEIRSMSEEILANVDVKFVAAIAAYDQENAGDALTPSDS